ncbi:ABC-ATPase domain-containing protein [Haloglycomyces albus]|uniref:ABC-ATPase domain-containing protein n=1 Tax=Haloglycomyces albus TaxID=526067 RepID=UPI00046CA61E|nr:ABC-ATPase domain-containing protein [Haloglycomyces albus]
MKQRNHHRYKSREQNENPRHNLFNELTSLEGAGYGRYKSLQGEWRTKDAIIEILRVQSDPFAPPSRVAIRFDPDQADLIEEWHATPQRRATLAVLLAKRFRKALRSRDIRIDSGGQEIVNRASCEIAEDGSVVFRVGVQFPGKGRRIAGRAAARVLADDLPNAADVSLNVTEEEAEQWIRHADDVTALREEVARLGLVAFVADGSMLARRSGVDDRPMDDGVPFHSPEELAFTVKLPHAGEVRGMGVKPGITLIVGGGFHGKSTLLRALEAGVYDHIPGDGREFVVCDPTAVKVRSEDGRSVTDVDVHAFVDHLPSGDDTKSFSTENASGSTSQAATTVESLEVGSQLLLIDEDTSATNLMIRDARMQDLVSKDHEPLTPLVDLIRSLSDDHGISTILVMGGSGDYMDVADRVVMMDSYRASDVTERAKELAAHPTGRRPEADSFARPRPRVVDSSSISSQVRGKQKIRSQGTDGIRFGDNDIDMRSVEQITDPSMTTGIALALELALKEGHLDGKTTLSEAMDSLDKVLSERGVAELNRIRQIDFAVPRRFEIAAAINRLRNLKTVD